MDKADIGLIGLAVMGENLAMNMESKGFFVCVYNRTPQKVADFISQRAKGKNISGAYSIGELAGSLKLPRKIMLMVKAGQAVDDFIELLIPALSPGDIIIDGGNSHFSDTIRRTEYVESKGLLYVGAGVSGGEEGALIGPSIMPGGSPGAWAHIKPIFQAIAAMAEGGIPCCGWVGSGGAGHFVKMVHNGIEYGDMQLICEAYFLMKEYLQMGPGEMREVFAEWNLGVLDSYLIEITRDILGYRDENGEFAVEKILDTAGQKGTGKWASEASLDEGVPLTLISEAVYARCLSAMKEERVKASDILTGPSGGFAGDAGEKKAFIEDIRRALFASKIISYAQGYALLSAASATYGWDLKYGEIAMLWRGGCIIRSSFLADIKRAFDRDPGLCNLLLDPFFCEAVKNAQGGWRRVCAAAVSLGIPVPAFLSALSYYDGYRCARLPANLLQAQRDYFGAHTYERVDRPRGEMFHTNWTGRGGTTAASAYTV
ncbi:MAG: decarboxylating NADP(+)-dependent phosphogluconate dehydrogenase [Oscillospiraceae bacterium]|nr:decarboxylating NADP(+)-dependent phosphogluconate dehydrogenase [Oscillospiraceae bacterium]